MKYVAIKIKGLDHWLWFEQKEVINDEIKFKGKNGWGKNGALTSIEINKSSIEGYIYSDILQYS